MNLRAALLAENAIHNSDGTFMVWKGGVNVHTVRAVPAQIHVVLILCLEADSDEAKVLHTLRLRVVHGGDEGPWQESPIAFKEVAQPQTIAYLNMLVNIHFGAGGPGESRIELELDDVDIPALHFRVDLARQLPGSLPPP